MLEHCINVSNITSVNYMSLISVILSVNVVCK